MANAYVYVTNTRWSGSPTAALKIPADQVGSFLANHPGERVIQRGENARHREVRTSATTPDVAAFVSVFSRALRELSGDLAPEAPRESARKRDGS